MGWRPLDTTPLRTLPQLDERELRLLRVMHLWDGPLDGLLEYRGERLWFQLHTEGQDEGAHYCYVIYRLPQAELAQLDDWFRRLDQWTQLSGEARTTARYLEFVPEWDGPDVASHQQVGWFTDGRNESFYGIPVQPS